MTIVKCKECGGDVSTTAKSCPKCGAKPPKRTSLLTWIFGGVVLVVVLKIVASSDDRAESVAANSPKINAPSELVSDGSTSARPMAANAGASGENVDSKSSSASLTDPKIVSVPKWTYSSDTDEMTGKTRKTASLDAENTISLPFPYAGQNQPRLIIRKDGHGLAVMLTIEQGQMMCQSYSQCAIRVRFDSKPPITFYGSGPADSSTTTAFLSPETRFIQGVRTAKQTLIQMTIYNAGEQTFRFDTRGLEWK